jgi:iron(III) transport system substrate-binding protein
LVVYSGRSERLVGPLLARFGEAQGVELEVRYADTAQLAATLLEEGAASPADVFFSQDALALGAVAANGMLLALPQEILDAVPQRFVDGEGAWVGVSGRVRTLVYNPERIDASELPQTLQAVADERYRGRFGVAPTNASFQAHMALYLAVAGEEALEELLAGLAANEPRRYASNGAIVEAVSRGEVDFGLVNHYYLHRALAENPTVPARNAVQDGAAASSFVNVAGVGVLTARPEALALVRFLLSEEAQRYFSEETFEYPLAAGVEPAVALPPLDTISSPDVDYGTVSSLLPKALEQIHASGLVG